MSSFPNSEPTASAPVRQRIARLLLATARLGLKSRGVLAKTASAVLVIVLIVSLTFLASRVFTADPVNLFVGNSASTETREKARAELGLADPLPVQYLHFLGGLTRGDLGRSYLTGRPVSADLMSRLPATIELGLYALILGIAGGIVAGVLAAVNQGGVLDATIRAVTIGALSLPQFWIGLMLLWLFFVNLQWLPGPSGRLPIGMTPPDRITGLYVVDALLHGQTDLAIRALRQLVLPVITLALGVFAPIARLVRSAMVESLESDYIRTARAMGISTTRIWFAYALKPGLLSVLTIAAGLVGWVLAGSVLVESIFAWPGIGQFALTAIKSSDYPVIQGFVLYVSVVYVVIWAILEYVYSRVDPRVRAQ
ncbi:ABC transporter permease [Salipiger abyssi]|uniref:ABC transporter permease n=1 Tax=Salipiger abyssi TaxID=1250539 RepID=UPI001A8E1282|nr:ABC transporter permease [Salipiger abyssi]MBN9888189.1 ABC transporter permease [Salipiger abyssi]